jgi:hypothetical protein
MMMQTRRVLILIALIGALAVGGCAAPAAAPAAPAAGGPPQVTLTTNPNPASSAGETEFVVEVKDSAGKPLSGVKVLVTADMAAHSMGAMQGEATDQGNGRYATKIPFGMAGDWKVTIEVRQTDTILATQDFIIPVQ